ncbi:MAG: hypothetical protein BroJett011_18980 [Chloroflexota bacterium]|nr:MAG: hypothetical protein BroJett011_18980 [Chloroflexota bacterium]
MMSEKLKKNWPGLTNWLNNLDLEQTRESVHQESQARIVLLGLAGAGKSSLFNHLCGWTVSTPQTGQANGSNFGARLAEPIEDFGLFCLVDLPEDLSEYGQTGLFNFGRPDGFSFGLPENGFGYNPGLAGTIPLGTPDSLILAEGANLLIYVLDGAAGLQPADYRWIGRLRRLGVPLLIVLNKSDLIETDLPGRQTEIESRLGARVLPVSALTGANISDSLLSKMMHLCPNLTVALGRELRGFRSQAAERLIGQAALVNGLVALEPIPLVDLPVQIINLAGLMLRIATLYDRPANNLRRREVVIAIAGGLAGRYAAQQVAKLIPVVGWAASGLIGWSCTWGLGRAAIAYFEAEGDSLMDKQWHGTKNRISQICRSVYGRWQSRPRLRVEIVRADSEKSSPKVEAGKEPEKEARGG